MVELTYLALFGIAMAAMFFGYGFGLFEGRNQGYKKRKKEEATEKSDQPSPEPKVVTETVTKTMTVDDPGLLRIKNEGGAYTLDLDGTRVHPATLPVEQRKRLIEILSIMRPWLEGRPAPPPPPPASTPAAFTPTSSGMAPASQSSLLDRLQSRSAQATPSDQPPSAPAADIRPVAPTPPAPPATPPPAAPKSGTIAKDDRPAAPAGSMVSQIDTILQSRLVGTPLEERGVFLTQSPEGGVNVYIGLTRYNGIDDVLDPEIKAAIRAAIAEWEQKFTPGLK
jgi:hypothetical protein